jgi:hypothetical protein
MQMPIILSKEGQHLHPLLTLTRKSISKWYLLVLGVLRHSSNYNGYENKNDWSRNFH